MTIPKAALIALTLPLALALAGCGGDAGGRSPDDQCGAGALQGLVGQPRTVLEGMTFADGTRIIEPGTPVTLDYRPDRLNIGIDEAGRIGWINCT